MRLVLVDDEKRALEQLEYFLEQDKDIVISNKYTTPLEMLENIHFDMPDVVFLDIDMPLLDGFTLAKEILRINSMIYIVFVTAYNDHAVKAFEMDALDYILKPVEEDRINHVIKKIKKLNIKSSTGEETKVEKLEKYITDDKNKCKKIPAWRGEKIVLIDICDILFFTFEKGEVVAYNKENERYTLKETLAYWEERTKGIGFFRSHKSFIVNTDKIVEITPWFNNTYNLKIKNYTEKIPVSRSYSKTFKEIFKI